MAGYAAALRPVNQESVLTGHVEGKQGAGSSASDILASKRMGSKQVSGRA